MKKVLLATAVAALSISAAQAAPQVYGKAFLTLDYQDFGDESKTALNSTGSKVGFKGAEALTNNTDLVYQLEYGVDVDSNAKTQFRSRDTYLGLSNKQYGTALAGRLTAIDDMVNYANVTAGGVLGGDDVLASVSAPRADNAVAYVSPNYNGFNALAMYALDSDQDKANDDLAKLGLSNYDKYGVGFQYEPTNQPYRLGATYIGIGSDLVKDFRISGSYDINPALTVGALYQMLDIDGAAEKENAFALSGTYKTATPWTAYGQLDLVQNQGGAKDADDVTRVVVGGKYGFNKATTGHVYAAAIDDGSDDTQFGVGTGIEYKF
ncbi:MULTISPECIES: porin [unclassified Moraxella]|uniref:porin n=1 Tax=unclassified Moraxella TaxID=2685852 RepID=UPI003AF4CC63